MRNKLLIGILLWQSLGQAIAQKDVERFIWKKEPLSITLPVGKERLVTFPANVKLGIPESLFPILRTQSYNGTVYWRAEKPFEAQRIEVREDNGTQIFLVDLQAKKNGPTVPVEVWVDSQDKNERINPKDPARSLHAPGYAEMTRHAVQQLYAPLRLARQHPAINRVPIVKESIGNLIRGAQVKATPLISWSGGDRFYVTAVELINTESNKVILDPRELRGKWLAATFYDTILYPVGSDADTTVVFVISDRPYYESI